jgi:hypothetical protein
LETDSDWWTMDGDGEVILQKMKGRACIKYIQKVEWIGLVSE